MTDKNIRFLTGTALMTAALCVLGPMSLPIGPVPITLTNLTIYFFLYILGTKQSAAAYLVYLLVGMAGLPVDQRHGRGPDMCRAQDRLLRALALLLRPRKV